MEIENCFYRISAKALVLNETRNKFLICKKENGVWELPGGGLDWGTTPQEDIPREIQEEMGIVATKIASLPSYFFTGQTLNRGVWIANIIYEVELENLTFVPSDECVEIKFVGKEDVVGLNVFPTIKKLVEMFNPEFHREKL